MNCKYFIIDHKLRAESTHEAMKVKKVLNLVNIRTSIMNYDEDERTVRTTYSSSGGNPDTIYLSSQGVYRLLLINLNAFYFKNLFKDI